MMKKICYVSPAIKVCPVRARSYCLTSVNNQASTESFTNGDSSDLGEDWD